MLAKWYYEVDDIDFISIQTKSFFMIFYGYIDIEGNWDNNMIEEIRAIYNSLAVNDIEISKVRVPSNPNILIDSYDTGNSSEEEIELSEKIVFLKRSILRKLRMNNLTEQQIPELLKKLQKTEKTICR